MTRSFPAAYCLLHSLSIPHLEPSCLIFCSLLLGHAEELRQFCQQFQEDAPIITPEYRERYLEEAFKKYPDFNKPQLYNAFSKCVSKLEDAIRTNYSVGELGVLRQEFLMRRDMEEISRAVAEAAKVGANTNQIARENNSLLKENNSLLKEIRDAPPTGEKPGDGLNTHNETYQKMFTETLFLHSRDADSKVKLCNLFVMPKFEQESVSTTETINSYLTHFLHPDETRFLRSDKPQFLFIEGDAGCGKSSLTAYVNYHYENRDATAQAIFRDMRLITVRLRNLDGVPTDCKSSERLKRAVLRFLYGTQADAENLKRFRKSGACALWLDGFDELCVVEGIEDAQAALWGLENLDCKIIVTTRPAYIQFDRSRNYQHISLRHFDAKQRRDWLKRYKQCGERLGKTNRKYLERIQNENDTAGICDTPLGLYMVAAGHFTEEALDNEWALYRQIFHDEIQKTEYNKPYDDFTLERMDAKYWDSLYRVSEEVAWYLYQRKNENLLVPGEEVTKIIKALNFQEDEEKVIEHCYALCGYWKTDAKRGYVEFYHNNIRDFFLCEKLMRELNRAYGKYGKCLQDASTNIFPFLKCLCELFQYGELERQVLWFLRQRSDYTKEPETDICVKMEREHHNTARIFETLLTRGEPYQTCEQKENPVKIVTRILYNTVGVYRHIYEPFLQEKERIRWWNKGSEVKAEFLHFPGEIFQLAGYSDLLGIDLRGAHLQRADLHSAYLRSADLQGADLTDADLTGADLQGADLRGAKLRGVKLQNTDLSGADLRLTEGYDLIGSRGKPITV